VRFQQEKQQAKEMPEASRPEERQVFNRHDADCSYVDEVVSDEMAVILRNKTPAERLKIAFGMWKFARELIARRARAEHPEWSEAELDRHVAHRMSHGAI
jgi:hypothetical protein